MREKKAKKELPEDLQQEPTSYSQTWTRGADGSFNDVKKEKFALHLAGGASVRDAGAKVGISLATASNWAATADMRERKRILRARPQVSQTFVVSVAMVVEELYRNAMAAREVEQFKASNDALLAMYEIGKNEKSLLETFQAVSGEDITQKDVKNIIDGLRQRPALPESVDDGAEEE